MVIEMEEEDLIEEEVIERNKTTANGREQKQLNNLMQNKIYFYNKKIIQEL